MNNKIKSTICRLLILFWIFGSTYTTLEVFYRGYSHWSMFLLAGMAGVIIGGLDEIKPQGLSLLKQGIIGSILITILELICGLIVNVWLKLNVWDYSNMSFNFMGQICLSFSLLWVLLSIICVIVDDYLRYLMFDEPIPKHNFINKHERKE